MTGYPRPPRFTTGLRALLLVVPHGLFALLAAYFGYRHTPYNAIILLTVINTVYFYWWAALSFRYAWYSASLIMIVIGCGAVLLAELSLFYFYPALGLPL
jgi:hypothetical protein